MLEGLVKPAKKYDAHAKFAEHSQLLRWFRERSIKELKSLRKAFETAKGLQPTNTNTTTTKDKRYD